MVDRRPIGDAGQRTHMRRRAAVAGREPDEGKRRADGGGGRRNEGHHRRVVYATEKIVKKGPGIWQGWMGRGGDGRAMPVQALVAG